MRKKTYFWVVFPSENRVATTPADALLVGERLQLPDRVHLTAWNSLGDLRCISLVHFEQGRETRQSETKRRVESAVRAVARVKSQHPPRTRIGTRVRLERAAGPERESETRGVGSRFR